MTKKLLCAGVFGFAVLLRATAQLAVTEVMSGESDKNHPDWFELHNYGTNDIDLTGYGWNDDAHGGFSGADSASFNGVTIHAGETIICTEQKGVVTDAPTFNSWWGLDGSMQVVVLDSNDPGLSANPLVAGTKRADSVRLWRTNLAALGANTNGLDLDECSDFLVQRVDLGDTTSQSLLFNPASGVFDILSTGAIAGTYTNSNGEVGSPGAVPAALEAAVVQTPLDQTVTVGDTAFFTNGGIALPPLVFHWYFNNNPITSQTPGVSVNHLTPGLSNPLTNDISVLTLTGVQTTNAGTYTVIASNGLESFTNTAVLTVNTAPTPPSIEAFSPALDSFEGYSGQTVNFSVQTSGYPAPTYQWFKDNSPVPGQTSAQYQLALSDTNQSGVYKVVATNGSGSTNVSFTLNVTPVPTLVITEVMSGESADNSNGDTSGHNDWFELSNLGTFPVNLYGYRIDDSHDSLSASAMVTSHVIIHPSESVVFVQDMTPAQFRTWWGTNLPASVQIIDYNGSGQGLSGSGDEVHLWNAVAAPSDEIAAVAFGAGTDGNSFGFDLNYLDQSGFEGALTTAGVDGAFVATVGGDIGSPGAIINMPRFVNSASSGGPFSFSWYSQPNWHYTIQYKTNLDQASWTTLTHVTSSDSTVTSYIDPALDPQRFYRVFLNLNNQ